MKRAELLRRILADCFCRLQPSPLHGVGVFAIRDIPKGRDPFRTLPKYATTGSVRATEDELGALPPKLAALVRALFVPTADTMWISDLWAERHLPDCLHQPFASPEPTDQGRRSICHQSSDPPGPGADCRLSDLRRQRRIGAPGGSAGRRQCG